MAAYVTYSTDTRTTSVSVDVFGGKKTIGDVLADVLPLLRVDGDFVLEEWGVALPMEQIARDTVYTLAPLAPLGLIATTAEAQPTSAIVTAPVTDTVTTLAAEYAALAARVTAIEEANTAPVVTV